jgi:hypothetical protein
LARRDLATGISLLPMFAALIELLVLCASSTGSQSHAISTMFLEI